MTKIPSLASDIINKGSASLHGLLTGEIPKAKLVERRVSVEQQRSTERWVTLPRRVQKQVRHVQKSAFGFLFFLFFFPHLLLLLCLYLCLAISIPVGVKSLQLRFRPLLQLYHETAGPLPQKLALWAGHAWERERQESFSIEEELTCEERSDSSKLTWKPKLLSLIYCLAALTRLPFAGNRMPVVSTSLPLGSQTPLLSIPSENEGSCKRPNSVWFPLLANCWSQFSIWH